MALLRGINVGGKNIVKMDVLRSCFERLGFWDVGTYIQSGNLVFMAEGGDSSRIASLIERALGGILRHGSHVVVIPAGEFEEIVLQAPDGFGLHGSLYRYDVVFVRKPVTPAEVLEQVTTKTGVDTVHAGDRALYYRRLVSKGTQSRLSQLVQKPVYQHVTIRNWRTTTTLLAMLRKPHVSG